MRLIDRAGLLTRGLADIRRVQKVPDAFPAEVEAAGAAAARKPPTAHADRTDRPFRTLDPAGSRDLDQAFCIERSGADLLLHYAIADVAWFVQDGDALDREAWQRGVTLYLPDGKASLYPASLSEGGASLLPDGVRPAIICTIRVAPDGAVRLDGVERGLIRSRAKLAYATVREDELPDGFGELADRMAVAETRRGATSIDAPEQEVEALNGGYHLAFRPRLLAESRNAAMSLAANLAIADALLAHGTGLFRVMAEPDEVATRKLRLTARALRIPWPGAIDLPTFRRGLDAADPKQAALILAIRRAGSRASYTPYREGDVPWHSAMAATYCHATAPLRRLADRYVLRAVLAIAQGQPVPDGVGAAFEALPDVMTRMDSRQGQIDRAIIDLAEVVILTGREGQVFRALVLSVDERGARIQLRNLPVVAGLRANGLSPGEKISVRLVALDPAKRGISFEHVA